MTGGIHNNDAHNNYYCFTRLTDVKGTWGIYVDYQKTPDDADKQTGSKPVYGKRAQVNR
jgi:hypothetical protein